MRWLVSMALLVTAVACDRDDVPDALAAEGTIRLLVDSRTLESSNVTATISTSIDEILAITSDFTDSQSNTRLSISAYSAHTNNVISMGEYEFGSKTDKGPYDGVCQYVLNDGNAPFSTTAVPETYVGKVNITELDRTGLYVSGTFEATVGRNAEVKSITKGSFTRIKLAIN